MQFILGWVFPWILELPIGFGKLINTLNLHMGEIAQEVLVNTRKESEGFDKTGDKSIIGLLSKLET